MKKRLFAMLLALVMCLALGPTAALAAEPECESGEPIPPPSTTAPAAM